MRCNDFRQVNISVPVLGVREKVTVLPELQKCLQSPVLPQTPRFQDQKRKHQLETESNRGAQRATESTQTQHSCQQLNTNNEDKN